MSLLQMSISSAIMILAVIVIRALAINRLPKKTFIALWGIVMLRLLVPFSFPSPLSAYSLMNNQIPATNGIVGLGNANIVPNPLVGSPTIGGVVQGQTAVSVSPYTIIWGIGLIICILFFAVSYFKCRREFRESLPIKSDFLTQWIAEHKLSRPIEIRQSSRISAPLTYGVFKPIILMPKNTNWDDTKQIEYILAHEFVHVRRFDAATKLLLTVALCIHWFNPLVWAMYILSNRDIELSCDETVVRSFGNTNKSAYALILISMEEKKNSLTPLCNNFSKNAIEERITAIMKMKKTSVVATFVAIALIISVTTAFATSAATSNKELMAIPNTNFSQADYDQLLALRFDGYEKMTVAEYQKKVWTIRDTDEYMALLERFNQDTQLYDMRYTNDTASFLFNTLIPLTAEKWQTRDFGGYTQAPDGDVQGDHAMLEYQISLTILDNNRLTVREYEQARQGVMNGLQKFLQGKSNAELQDENTMDTAIRTEIAALRNRWETPALQIAVEYSFMPLSLYESPNGYVSNSYEQEKRPYPHATEADYQSLLKLKTADYQNQSVSSFNAALLEWENEDYERNERINIDRAWNDFEVALTNEERSFVTLTALASGVENAKLVQSHYTGRAKEDPILGNFDLTKEVNENSRFAYANLWYQLTYHVSDENKLTIGERDQALAGVINGIQQFWDNTSIDMLLTMDEDNIVKEIKAIAEKYNNDSINISFTNDGISFECMSEPKMQE